MFVFRSLTIGLLGACVALLIRLETARPVAARPATEPVAASPQAVAAGPTIVDVAAGVRAEDVGQLVRLSPGERIVAFEDRRAADSSGFVDLDVASFDGTHRRVLVLLHSVPAGHSSEPDCRGCLPPGSLGALP